MFRIGLLLLCIFLIKYTNAQLFNHQWIIGQGYYYTADMSEDTPKPFINYDTTQLTPWIVENSSCVNDEFGNLILYTNGRDIMSDSGKIIEGGQGIMDSLINDIVWYGLEMSQSSIILPRLYNQYYVVYMSQDDDISRAGDQKPNYLYYAIVDMNANGGRGKVGRTKIPIINNDTIGDSRMTACRHANGRDWWLVCHGRELDNKINVILVTPDTIYLHHVQKNILPIYRELYSVAQSSFSPDGKHYIACTPNSTPLGLYDFNRCTGEFSNTRLIDFEHNDSLYLFIGKSITGCSFSPNSKYIYVNNTRMIAQFCIDSLDIMSTRKFVALYDTTYKNYAPFYTEMLAPNNNIYISNWNGTTNTYHVIHNPDTIAPFCNFRKEDLVMPRSRRTISLPNMPHYQLGTSPVYTLDAGNDTTFCDSMYLSLGIVPKYHLPLTGVLDEMLHIEWSASSSDIKFSDIHIPFPTISCNQKGNYQIYLSLHDTISTLTCTDRIDTMNISIIDCDTILPITFFIPTLWNKADGNYSIPALPTNSSFEVYNTIGQLVFKEKNYTNNWNTNKLSTGMYLYKLHLIDGKEYKGKVFVY